MDISAGLVSKSLADAAVRAQAEGKPIFAIYYDRREHGRGGLRYGLDQYFGNRKARVTLNSNFVVALVPVQDVVSAAPQLTGLSMEKARWAIFSPLLELLEHDVLNRNAGDGEKMLDILADRYD